MQADKYLAPILTHNVKWGNTLLELCMIYASYSSAAEDSSVLEYDVVIIEHAVPST